MINYILLSSLFSIAGGILYLILRHKLSFIRAKTFIYCIIICSLIFPVFKSDLIKKFITPNQLVMEVIDKESGTVINSVSFQSNKNVSFCLNKPQKKCSSLVSSKNEAGILILSNSDWPLLLMILLLFIGISGLIYKSSQLFKLTKMSAKEHCELENISFIKLTGSHHKITGAFSIFRNYILWPNYISSLGKEEQKAILLHEVSHLKQKNTIEKIGLSFLKLIWFFNPILYLFYKELDKISEFIADDYALASGICKKKYATLLLNLKVSLNCPHPLVQNLSDQSILKTRIIRIMKSSDELPQNTISYKGYMALVATLVFYLFFFFNMNLELNTFNTQQKLQQACSEVQASLVNSCRLSWR